VDTPFVWELNIWYHTLNAGFRTRISGETDFPCIYARPGRSGTQSRESEGSGSTTTNGRGPTTGTKLRQ
jgi:FPC/CPF motif-containing protein YcgG